MNSPVGQTSYERNGERVYGMTLACEQIERLAKAEGREDAPEDQDASAPQAADTDIPF